MKEKTSKGRVYSRKSRATRFHKVHVIHHPELKAPILLTPEPLAHDEPIVLVSDQTTLSHEEIHEAVKEKESWWSWLTG